MNLKKFQVVSVLVGAFVVILAYQQCAPVASEVDMEEVVSYDIDEEFSPEDEAPSRSIASEVNPTGQFEKLATKTAAPPVPNSSDILTWFHSQLPASQYVAVHAETRSCDHQKFVRDLYVHGLGRTPSSGEVNSHAEALAAHKKTQKQTRLHFAQSPEYLNSKATPEVFVKRLYSTMFSRTPAASEVNYHAANLKKGLARANLVNSFKASAEFENTPACMDRQTNWSALTNVYQPFKSTVDKAQGRVLWRKDELHANYYGEVFTFDEKYLYLRSETFPFFVGAGFDGNDAGRAWDARTDKFRLFAARKAGANAENNINRRPGGTGRILSTRKVDTNWRFNQILDIYACYNFSEFTGSRCRPFQAGFVDSKVFLERRKNFDVVYDGQHPKWPVSASFRYFDEVVIINQEMYGNVGRERFILGFKGGKYYGIVRWDSSITDPRTKKWMVVDRAVVLKLATQEGFSFEGMRHRDNLDK